jgi:hypothetical protein
MPLVGGGVTACPIQSSQDLELAVFRRLCDVLTDNSLVLEMAAAQISEIDCQLQDAGRVVCNEFQIISAAVDKSDPQVKEALERIVVALQFEDRFSQRLTQVSRALALAGRLTEAVLTRHGIETMTTPEPVLPAGSSPFELLRAAAEMVPSTTESAEVDFFE